MKEKLKIRRSLPCDLPAIESLYPEAFPDEDLLPLVRDLLLDATVTTSTVGLVDTQVAAHVIFTECGVAGKQSGAALLGPLAVAPSWQGQGIGSAMVRNGLRRLEDTNVRLIFVLGDPAFYSRLGFRSEYSVRPPFRLPAEWSGAWQSLRMSGAEAPSSGALSVPPQWLQPALWGP